MAPQRTDRVPSAGRIALLGAGSTAGVGVRRALEAMQISGDRVELFGAGELVLSEYDGESRMIQEADRASLERHDLIFICEDGDPGRRLLTEPPAGAVTLDLSGCGFAEFGLPLGHDHFLPPRADAPGAALAVPHPLALLLADILVPLQEGPGLREAAAVVLRPASDFGGDAVEELRRQTAELLTFGSPPVEHLGRQLAFNVLPDEYQPGPGSSGDTGRLAGELGALTGIPASALWVETVAVPMFYGHGVSLQVTAGGPVEVGDLYRLLDGRPGLRAVPDHRGCTPVEVGGQGGTCITGIRRCGGDRYRLWGAADEAETRSVVQAIRLARMLGAL